MERVHPECYFSMTSKNKLVDLNTNGVSPFSPGLAGETDANPGNLLHEGEPHRGSGLGEVCVVREFHPGRNTVGVLEIGNPLPKVAVIGNLGLEGETPLVWTTLKSFPLL
ncbi:MAG: hypothetical protein ACRCXD_13495 [Luteolibacter sp.]